MENVNFHYHPPDKENYFRFLYIFETFPKNNECHPKPRQCSPFTFTGEEECTCENRTQTDSYGAICRPGLICVNRTAHHWQCLNVSVCTDGVTMGNNQHCYCNVSNSLCSSGQFCDHSSRQCVQTCPAFPQVNHQTSPCFCSSTEYCDHNEICGGAGCLPKCPDLGEESTSDCYCGRRNICNSGHMCDPSNDGTCWSNIDNCSG